MYKNVLKRKVLYKKLDSRHVERMIPERLPWEAYVYCYNSAGRSDCMKLWSWQSVECNDIS